MKLNQLSWPVAILASAAVIAAAIVANGVQQRPARYTFEFNEAQFRVWRGDNVTGKAVVAFRPSPEEVVQELIYLPASKKRRLRLTGEE